MLRKLGFGLGLLSLSLLFYFCTAPATPPRYDDRVIEIEPTAAAELSGKLRAEASVELAEGLELDLWASDTLVQDPIAISVAPDGRIFYTQATRQTSSEFDIRGHRDWMTASISFQTVEDRREFLRKTFSENSDQSERFLKDLNEDGVLDWRDLTVEKEQVWFVTDRDGDGTADRSQLYLEDFGEEVTDVANGVEFHDGEVYISVGPDMWRTKDNDGDGIADETESLAHGFAVHIGFGGHGMSGATVGPLGRIWWGIGDIGMNLVDKDGKEWKYPNRGVVVRADPDGSNFEVFAMGVRNTHEFVFDEYGNLISEDNDGDHPGESERLVYLIDGSDTGWRINWQFGKYSDPDNNDYKVWMDEEMYKPRWDGQAAYFLPTITNYVNGPTGMVYNPGTALSPEYYKHFFIAEFRGNPANSPIHAFTLEADGAGFALGETRQVVSGLLPTGLDFGADGALYFGDWINGWNTKDAGRIWKMDAAAGKGSAIRQETMELLRADISQTESDQLYMQLGHQDMRVRRQAQFELVKREQEGLDVLQAAARAGANQMARIHGMWGIAQMARNKLEISGELTEFLNDPDAEIIAQTAKLLGDLKYTGASGELIKLVGHPNPRVSFFAAEALGRTEDERAIPALLQMIEANNDEDTWLRMVATIALGRIGKADPLVDLKSSESRALRTAAVVALRRMESPAVAEFLEDEDEYVVAEAARAINDDFSIEAALPALAASLDREGMTSEPFLRRAINANLRVGERENAERLANYAKRGSAPKAMRAEALAALGTWGRPSVFDRVDGRYRGVIERDSTVVIALLEPDIESMLRDRDAQIRLAALKATAKLGVISAAPTVNRLLRQDSDAEVRAAAISALGSLNTDGLERALEAALADRDGNVRARALSILPESSISAERAVNLYAGVLRRGSEEEQQAALTGLGELKGEKAAGLLSEQLALLSAGKMPAKLQLDVIEAVEKQEDPNLAAGLEAYAAADELGLYRATLEGGNQRAGQRIFYNNESAQCVRCHAVFEYGGNVGPGLEGVADRMTRRQLLNSLIAPSAEIAVGYETVLLTLSDSSMVSGTVLERTDEEIRVKIGKEDIQTYKQTDLLEQETLPSSMPTMIGRLSKREIRDLVAFLGSLHGEESK